MTYSYLHVNKTCIQLSTTNDGVGKPTKGNGILTSYNVLPVDPHTLSLMSLLLFQDAFQKLIKVLKKQEYFVVRLFVRHSLLFSVPRRSRPSRLPTELE